MSYLPPPKLRLLIYSPNSSSFNSILSLLFEPNNSLLINNLIPELHSHLKTMTSSSLPQTYKELIDLLSDLVEKWSLINQAKFISSHPRIGEQGKMSILSTLEQSATTSSSTTATTTGTTTTATSGQVLKRLTILNSLYEESFPGLRFVTFVNGRSKEEIIPELEAILSLSLPPPSASIPEPTLSSLRARARINVMGSSAWRNELTRASGAIWDIGKARIRGMGAE